MPEVHVETGYRPRPLQLEVHRSLKRFNVLVCHRRFGKTVLCINELIDKSLRCQLERPRHAYVAPLYKQAKTVAWDYLKSFTRNIPGTTYNEAELRADLPGGRRIQLYGADNYDSLRGIYLDGVVLDEYAQMPPKAWSEVIRPALTDRQGFAIFIGTPKGFNAFHELYDGALNGFRDATGQRAPRDPAWAARLYRASQTGIIPAAELAAARREMSEDEYEQEFECSFQAAVQGAYYGKLMSEAESDGRVRDVRFDPVLKVGTAWDLGMDDSTAIWFFQQTPGGEIRLIDYYEASGEGLDHYARVLQQRAIERGYVYGDHLLPHDVEVRELGTGKSRLEVLRTLGLGNIRVIAAQSLPDGINAVRVILPRCWFDRERCGRGITALSLYRREWDDVHRVFYNKPLHDEWSHGADAFRYLALGLRDHRARTATPQRRATSWMAA